MPIDELTVLLRADADRLVDYWAHSADGCPELRASAIVDNCRAAATFLEALAGAVNRLWGSDAAERIACAKAGTVGHHTCGLCLVHQRPRYACGCILRVDDAKAK